jgi:hypothetical protein
LCPALARHKARKLPAIFVSRQIWEVLNRASIGLFDARVRDAIAQSVASFHRVGALGRGLVDYRHVNRIKPGIVAGQNRVQESSRACAIRLQEREHFSLGIYILHLIYPLGGSICGWYHVIPNKVLTAHHELIQFYVCLVLGASVVLGLGDQLAWPSFAGSAFGAVPNVLGHVVSARAHVVFIDQETDLTARELGAPSLAELFNFRHIISFQG